MQGTYTHNPETNYVPREYGVAAILMFLFMVLIYYYILLLLLLLLLLVCSSTLSLSATQRRLVRLRSMLQMNMLPTLPV